MLIPQELQLSQNNPYLCIDLNNKRQYMNQMFIHILLCGIIILLAKSAGSECRA